MFSFPPRDRFFNSTKFFMFLFVRKSLCVIRQFFSDTILVLLTWTNASLTHLTPAVNVSYHFPLSVLHFEVFFVGAVSL